MRISPEGLAAAVPGMSNTPLHAPPHTLAFTPVIPPWTLHRTWRGGQQTAHLSLGLSGPMGGRPQ